MAVITVNADYSILITDQVILVDATSNDVQLTLPGTHPAGMRFIVKDKLGQAQNNSITIITPDTDTIDDQASASIVVKYQSLVLHSDGSNWAIL